MAGSKLAQARKALRFCLDSLSPRDRFEVVRFSTETEPLFGGLVPADRDHIAKAESFVDGLSAIGGTAIANALDEALYLPGAPERPSMVIFLTDGIPTVGRNVGGRPRGPRRAPVEPRAFSPSASETM